jgi:hypothetical protein
MACLHGVTTEDAFWSVGYEEFCVMGRDTVYSGGNSRNFSVNVPQPSEFKRVHKKQLETI